MWLLVASAGLLCLQLLVSTGGQRVLYRWHRCQAELPGGLGKIVLWRRLRSSSFTDLRLTVDYDFRAEVRSRGHGRKRFDLAQHRMPVEVFLGYDGPLSYVRFSDGTAVELDGLTMVAPDLPGASRIGVFRDSDKGVLVFVPD